MKRMAINLLLMLAVSVFLLVTFSCRRGVPSETSTSGPSTASTSSSPSATSQDPSAAPTSSSLSATSQPQSSPSTQPPVSSQATKSGWWVRINPGMTLAQSITFQIGTSKLQREEWRVWRAGEPAEFDVPEKYLQVPRLYLRGNVSPIGKIATLCMMYKDHGVEHMSFDDDEAETKSQTQIDFKCR